jgi:UDP-N-acetylmuramoyl-L-alanyl-D-glutamate--2,6-diaminopimelate ligase
MQTAVDPTRVLSFRPGDPVAWARVATLLDAMYVSGDCPAVPARWHIDSRRVQPGDGFIALRGVGGDGHAHIAAALAAGAAAIIGDRPQTIAAFGKRVPAICVHDTHAALRRMALLVFGPVFDRITLYGVTGTNGKTSTAWHTRSILTALGTPCGMIGTIEIDDGTTRAAAAATTTDFWTTMETLARMRDAGLRACAMEVSSHAVVQRRVEGLPFASAVMTSLSRDHLDYHGTFEAYAGAKRSWIQAVHRRDGAIAVHADDPVLDSWMRSLPGSVGIRTTTGRFADCPEGWLSAEMVKASTRGTSFVLREGTANGDAIEYPIVLPIPGRFSVRNLLGAVAAVRASGVPLADIAPMLGSLPAVPGRLEPVANPKGRTILVDYAHTPDALENVLTSLRQSEPDRPVVTVFGCGGDRDRGKRPMMAGIAARLSNMVVVTSDNPRTEDPAQILLDVTAGLPEGSHAHIEADRATAIRWALSQTPENWAVLIAGKGHEDYQIVGRTKHPFDDREEVRRYFGATHVSA